MTNLNTLGQLAFNTYGDARNWTAYNGEPIPDWTTLPDNAKNAWTAAATTIHDYVLAETLHKVDPRP